MTLSECIFASIKLKSLFHSTFLSSLHLNKQPTSQLTKINSIIFNSTLLVHLPTAWPKTSKEVIPNNILIWSIKSFQRKNNIYQLIRIRRIGHEIVRPHRGRKSHGNFFQGWEGERNLIPGMAVDLLLLLSRSSGMWGKPKIHGVTEAICMINYCPCNLTDQICQKKFHSVIFYMQRFLSVCHHKQKNSFENALRQACTLRKFFCTS